MRMISVDERRARLARRHHLVPSERTDDVVRIVDDLVALHATDASTVHLSAAVRMAVPSTDALVRALYDDRRVLRMLGMRRTMFVVADALAPVVQVACTDAIAVVERRKLVQHLQQGGIAKDGARWLKKVEADTMRAMQDLGEATASELSTAVPALRAQMTFGEGKKWGGTQGVATRVLSLLAAEGQLVRGRPRGSWTSNQYRWAPMAAWIGDRAHSVNERRAEVELVRRYLRSFGPATVADVRWWTGWTAGKVNRALGGLDVEEVGIEDGTAILLADDGAEEPPVRTQWAALLPSLDSTAMGWAARDWYLGPHREALFDRSGNIGPTIWSNGRIVGVWAQRRDGEVVHQLLEQVGRAATRAISTEIDRVAALIGSARVTPRFRTPAERLLVEQ